MAAEVAQHASLLERLSAEDFETASIRSAAPSYISEAPSYHSTLPSNEDIPAYTPRSAAQTPSRSSTTTPSISTNSPFSPGAGLPRLASPPPPRRSQVPTLSEFRIPSWSSTHANPAARHYQAVANRRATAASSRESAQLEDVLRNVLGKLNEDEERNRLRPLEDPYLVGEEAAARARRERLARENGDEILMREDRRWDWFLAQMKDWDERDRSWSQFRREVESGQRGKLARRIGRLS